MIRAALCAALFAGAAQAHEPGAERRVLVSAEPDVVRLVVRYTLPGSAAAARLRALVVADGDLVVKRPVEKLARAQQLVPRASKGLALAVDDRVLQPTLKDARFRDLGDQGLRTGFEALLLYEAPWRPTATHRVLLRVAGLSSAVEMQAAKLELVDSSLPRRAKDPVAGPERLSDGVAWISVRVPPEAPALKAP